MPRKRAAMVHTAVQLERQKPMNATSLLEIAVPDAPPAGLTAPILLVERPDELRQSRRLLLSCIHPGVQVADNPSRVFAYSPDTSFHLIVIDLQERISAEHIAFYARRRWPGAKILLLGRSCGEFQDSLYDEIVDPCCNPVGFVEAGRRLLTGGAHPAQQRSR